ncbi:MAG TPA: twin-arginine translocase subunit TatC [Polyangiaceae bacterium]|nr:twin-arginine translocase subunit TatC [Polyangiaceae bacterium]
MSDGNNGDGKSDPPKGEDGSMTLWEHLEELRSRIVRMAIAFLVGAVVCWIYKERILSWLTRPFLIAWQENHLANKAELHYGGPAALFIAYVHLAALAGFIVALPFILYQLWAFIAPGLYSREKRFAIPFVVSSCGLFALGGYFGWAVAFPRAFGFLLSFSAPTPEVGPAEHVHVVPTVMIGDYIDFVLRMFIAFGATAELPILVLFLSVAGLITHRHLIKFFRYFIVVAFIISAVLTPPDPMSQILMAVPLIGLYGVSIGVAWFVTKGRERRNAQAEADEKKSDGDKKDGE